jgi:hypothetical protein
MLSFIEAESFIAWTTTGLTITYCYMLEWNLVSDATMQMDGLSATPHNNAVHYYVRDNGHGEICFLRISIDLWSWFVLGDCDRRSCSGSPAGHVSCYSGRWRKSIVRASRWQFSDGLYAEVLFWRASGPTARRWIVLTCLESCWLYVLSCWTEINIHRE